MREDNQADGGDGLAPVHEQRSLHLGNTLAPGAGVTATRVVHAPDDVARELNVLGIPPDDLTTLRRRAACCRASCHEHHPPSYPGIVAWAEHVRGLRDLLVPLGWRVTNESNLPLIASPDGRYRIAACTGDEETGLWIEAQPRTQHPRGPATTTEIAGNLQLALDFGPSFVEHAFWILLSHFDGCRHRAELSLPTVVSDGGTILKWHTRIILPSLTLVAPQSTLDDASPSALGLLP